MNGKVWSGRRVLVTGHTGFKGAWLCLWLERLGATVLGVALPAPTGGAFEAIGPAIADELILDIRNGEALREVVAEWAPEVVLHLAAQALVPESYRDPIGTFATNVMGTVNVVSAAIAAGSRAVVVVTSDKVYDNDGTGRPFVESDGLGGGDPYSASKACADIAARALARLPSASSTGLAVARAGNVIGGGDVAADRLLPDAWRAATEDRRLELRSPDAVRPWQFVLEPLHGYLLLAERLMADPAGTPEALNFGPARSSCRPVREVVDLAFGRLGRGSWNSRPGDKPHEAHVLQLDATLAHETLGWRPQLSLEQAVNLTINWWSTESVGGDLRALALLQLSSFA